VNVVAPFADALKVRSTRFKVGDLGGGTVGGVRTILKGVPPPRRNQITSAFRPEVFSSLLKLKGGRTADEVLELSVEIVVISIENLILLRTHEDGDDETRERPIWRTLHPHFEKGSWRGIR